MFKVVSFKLVGNFRTLYQSTQFLEKLLTPVSTSCKNQPSFVEIDLSLLSIRAWLYNIPNHTTRHRRGGDLCPRDYDNIRY